MERWLADCDGHARGEELVESVLDPLLKRVRAEYMEMPGLSLTAAQAQRLLGLERHTCEAVLTYLIESRFLRRTDHGLFVRARRA